MEREHEYRAEPDLPLAVTHAEMNAAYDIGAAVLLAPSVSWLTRHKDFWWVVYESGWLRITDEVTAADIDCRASRLNTVESQQEEPCPQPRS